MKPKIEMLLEKRLVGMSMKMSASENKTGELWAKFAPRLKEITNKATNKKISMQVYESSYFDDFNPNNEFVKWAAVEATNFDTVPHDMETFILTSGLYAVFEYKGSSTDNTIFQYIFTAWLPNSDYILDDRPHFEVLGKKYKNNDPNSEEEIWIPIKQKQ